MVTIDLPFELVEKMCKLNLDSGFRCERMNRGDSKEEMFACNDPSLVS